MERKLITDEQRRQIAEADQVAIFEIGRSLFPREEITDTHLRDLLASLEVLCPGSAGRASILRSSASADAAREFVKESLGRLRDDDPELFMTCSKAELADLWGRFSNRATARATADRAGVEESRREAYGLRHKIKSGGRDRPLDERRRERVLGFDRVEVGGVDIPFSWEKVGE